MQETLAACHRRWAVPHQSVGLNSGRRTADGGSARLSTAPPREENLGEDDEQGQRTNGVIQSGQGGPWPILRFFLGPYKAVQKQFKAGPLLPTRPTKYSPLPNRLRSTCTHAPPCCRPATTGASRRRHHHRQGQSSEHQAPPPVSFPLCGPPLSCLPGFSSIPRRFPLSP
jgi:hypothetical protein